MRACVRVTFERYRGMTVFSLPSSLPFPDAGNRRLRKTVNGSAMQFALHTRAVYAHAGPDVSACECASAEAHMYPRERMYLHTCGYIASILHRAAVVVVVVVVEHTRVG